MSRKRVPAFLELGGEHNESRPDPLAILYAILGRLASQIRRADDEGRDVTTLIRERWKVVNWLVPDRGCDLDAKTLRGLRDFGLSVEQIEAHRAEMQRRRRGRPVTQRYAAVMALREQLRSPEKIRAEIAAQVCRCSRKTHGKDCVADLWAEVRRLKRYLEQYGYTTRQSTLQKHS